MKQKFAKWLLVTFLLVGALPLWAQNGVRLSMTFRNELLPAALEQSSSYKFLFTYEDVSSYRVSGTVKDASFFQIVDFLLRDKPLHYTVNGKFVNIVKGRKDADKAESGKMQTVGGYVYDAKTKEPVIGAQVKVLGSNVVTVTDINGAFSFDYYLTGGQQLGRPAASGELYGHANQDRAPEEADDHRLGRGHQDAERCRGDRYLPQGQRELYGQCEQYQQGTAAAISGTESLADFEECGYKY